MRTVKEYRAAYPHEHRATQLVAQDETGRIALRYFQGAEDKAQIGAEVSSFVYIGGWTVSIKEIVIK